MKKFTKVIISDIISYKIRYLCKTLPANFWSGILLFSTSESQTLFKRNKIGIKVIEETTITTEDIIPTHKYSLNEINRESKLMKYFNKKPHLTNKNWKTGYICSHGYTDAFFTNIDLEELTNNSLLFGSHFSLIVNNWGEKVAKLGIANGEVKIYNCDIEETNTCIYQDIDIDNTFINNIDKMTNKKKHSIQISNK